VPHAGIVIYPMVPCRVKVCRRRRQVSRVGLLMVPVYGQPEWHVGNKVRRQKPHNENDIDRICGRTSEKPAARPPVHPIAHRCRRCEIAAMDQLGSLTDH